MNSEDADFMRSAKLMDRMSKTAKLVVFTTSYENVCLIEFIKYLKMPYNIYYLNGMEQGKRISEALETIHNTKRAPWIFYDGKYIGDERTIFRAFRKGKLPILPSHKETE